MQCSNSITAWLAAPVPDGNELGCFTLPLWDDHTGELLSVLTCQTDRDNTVFNWGGPDRAGILEYATGLFLEDGVEIGSCHGARLKHDQGSFFELVHSPENDLNVQRM